MRSRGTPLEVSLSKDPSLYLPGVDSHLEGDRSEVTSQACSWVPWEAEEPGKETEKQAPFPSLGLWRGELLPAGPTALLSPAKNFLTLLVLAPR